MGSFIAFYDPKDLLNFSLREEKKRTKDSFSVPFYLAERTHLAERRERGKERRFSYLPNSGSGTGGGGGEEEVKSHGTVVTTEGSCVHTCIVYKSIHSSYRKWRKGGVGMDSDLGYLPRLVKFKSLVQSLFK